MDKSFNLTTQPWLPVVGSKKVSLLELFEDRMITRISGNPVEKLAIFRLLLAIAQAAYTPETEADWEAYSSSDLSTNVLKYLNEKSDCFDLFGDRPFLQVPQIDVVRQGLEGAKKKPVALIEVLDCEKPTNTKRVVFSGQIPKEEGNDRVAVLLLIQQAFGKGGKGVDSSIQLSNEFGTVKSAKPGIGLASIGLLHSHLVAETLLETIRLNLLTNQAINETGLFPQGMGVPPWEKVPDSQNCPTAQALKDTYLGRLVPMGRVCLLVEGGVVVIEGIQHPNYLDGRRDLTVSADLTGAKTKVLWSNTNKGPWRELTSILSFVSAKSGSSFENTQIKLTLGRARHMGGLIGVWSGGQKISFKTGEHYMTGLDDYVDSMTWLNVDEIGEPWFIQLETEMAILDRIAKIVFICVEKYFLSNGFQKPKKGHLMVASRASSQYWDKVSNIFFEMINLFGHHSEIDTVSKKRRQATHLANEIYNSFCPRLTARQLQGWAEHKPNFNSILRGS